MDKKKIVLTIAGSDPSGGAGIQADIKTTERLGLFPCSVITALTSQNTSGVKGIWEVDAKIIESQLDSVLTDFKPDAVKVGLVKTPEVVKTIARVCLRYDLPNIVVDPVLSLTLGNEAYCEDLIEAYVNELFPLAALVTPNIPEMEAIEKTCGESLEMLCFAFLLKGGHSEGRECVDILFQREAKSDIMMPSTAFPTLHFSHSSIFDQNSILPGPAEFTEDTKTVHFRHIRLDTNNTHGSGCVLSTAIACYLAKGLPLEEAVREGIKFLEAALKQSSKYKIGDGDYGPALI